MPPRNQPNPNARQRLGALGESVAARYLSNHGCRILERNYRRRWGEADLIALHPDGTYLLVEVRSRADRRYTSAAAHSIGPRKQRQLQRLAQGLLAELGEEADVRIDVIIVAPDERGRLSVAAHLESAVEEGFADDIDH